MPFNLLRLRARTLLLLGLFYSFCGAHPLAAQQPRAVLQQISNGPANDPFDPAPWVRAACTNSNSHYGEGLYLPYRVVIEELPLNRPASIEIAFTVLRQGGAPSIDFLTTYNVPIPHEQLFGHPAELIEPKLDLPGTFPPKTTFPIPAPQSAYGFNFAAAFAAFTAQFGPQELSIWNGVISAIDFEGYTGQPKAKLMAHYTIHFTATALPVIIAWGGHIASSDDYGRTARSGQTQLVSVNGGAVENGRPGKTASAARLRGQIRAPQLPSLGGASALTSALSRGGMTCSFTLDGGKPINPLRLEKAGDKGTAAGEVLMVYPNPARGSFTVQLPEATGGADIRLTDGLGRTIRQWQGWQSPYLKAGGLQPGVYLLDVAPKNTGRRITQKLMVH